MEHTPRTHTRRPSSPQHSHRPTSPLHDPPLRTAASSHSLRETTPLLTPVLTPRQITSDGTVVVIYPIHLSSHVRPCVFSMDPPPSIQEDRRKSLTTSNNPMSYNVPGTVRTGKKLEAARYVPTPMYRSRIAELNKILEGAHAKRLKVYKKVVLAVGFVFGVLVVWSLVVAARGFVWVPIIVGVVVVIVSFALKGMLRRVFFSKLLSSVKGQCKQLVTEWNNRSPPYLRFQIIGGGFTPDSLDDPELHVTFLDEPARPLVLSKSANRPVSKPTSTYSTPNGSYSNPFDVGESTEENEEDDVLVIPDESRDGLMMTVKIVKHKKAGSDSSDCIIDFESIR